MCLQEVSKKDAKWRNIALSLCKDKEIADDIVQEMYIKVKDYEEVNDSFVFKVIKHIFFDLCKQPTPVELNDNFTDETKDTSLSDEDLFILNDFKLLPFHQRIFLKEIANGKSLRDIEKETGINYGFVHREVTKARDILKTNLKWIS